MYQADFSLAECLFLAAENGPEPFQIDGALQINRPSEINNTS